MPTQNGESVVMRLLDKDRLDFTRADMLRVIGEKGIERLTFHYTSLDGKLRELKLPVSDESQAERILASGERVDIKADLMAGLPADKMTGSAAEAWAFINGGLEASRGTMPAGMPKREPLEHNVFDPLARCGIAC